MSIEMVSHPDHYNIPGKKECIVEMEEKHGADWVAIFCLLNAEKYDYRKGEKEGNPEDQDRKKIDWYRKYAIKLLSEGKIKNYIVCQEILRVAKENE